MPAVQPLSRRAGLPSASRGLALAILVAVMASALGERFFGHPSPWARLAVALNVLELGLIGLTTVALVVHPLWARAAETDRRRAAGSAAAGLACLGLAVLAARMVPSLSVAAAILGVSGLLGCSALFVLLPRSERSWLWSVAAVALGARLVAALVLHLYSFTIGPRGIAIDDESAYDYAALGLLRFMQEPGSRFADEWWNLAGHQLAFLTGLYWLFGAYPLAARIANAFIASGAVVLVAAVARTAVGRRAGLIVGLALALTPSLVFLSATLLKEALVLGLVALTLWLADRWRRQPSLLDSFLVLAVLHVLGVLRLYVALALALAIVLTFGLWLIARLSGARTAQRAAGEVRLRGSIAVASAVTLLVLAALFVLASRTSLWPADLVYRQTAMALTPPPYELLGPEQSRLRLVDPVGGEIVLVPGKPDEMDEPGMIIAYAPEGAGYYVATSRETLVFARPDQVHPVREMESGKALLLLSDRFLEGLKTALLAPLSTGMTSLTYVVLGGETLLWLMLLGIGLVSVWRRPRLAAVLPFVYMLAVLLVLTIVPGHPGNLIRQRTVLTLPALLLVASPMLAAMTQRGARRRGRGDSRLAMPQPSDAAPRTPVTPG